MRVHEPLQYLPQKGIPPHARMTCCMPNCTNKFVVAHGVAFPGTADRQQVEMFFFCSTSCYLAGVPAEQMPRA